MEITVEMLLPSLERTTTDCTTIKEVLEMIAVTVLEEQFNKFHILPGIGDRFILSDQGGSVCPSRFIVSERTLYMSLSEGKDPKIHFLMVELE